MDTAAAFHPHCQQELATGALFLPGWTEAELHALFAHGELLSLKAGEALVRRGDQERAIYLVVSGLLEVSSGSQQSQTLGRLMREGPGAVLGEVGLFDGQPRSASVWAAQATQLVKIPLAGLQAFCDADPRRGGELYFALGRVLAGRYRRSENRDRGALAG
jgi:CRP-like cAMP-binding protein